MGRLLSTVTPLLLLRFVAVYAIILAAAKFGQYLFFEWDTLPAILWPPTGIAIALMWLGGYVFAVPVFLALLTASVTGPTSHLIPAVVTTPFAQVVGHVAAVYLLKRFRFGGSLNTFRNVLVFLGVVTVTCMIAPTITTTISWLTDNLTTQPYFSWSRSWAGYILSALVLTPLILNKAPEWGRGPRRSYTEMILIGLLVLLSVYLLFWTRVASQLSFLLFALYFVAHFWVGYRFSTQAMAFAAFVSTVFGILGLFVSAAQGASLNNRLFAAELFFFLVLPLFYFFSALIQERVYRLQELKEAMRRIEQENNTKNEFIAVLAHELRNPLAPVKTTLEILNLQELPPDIKQLVVSAHRQVHSMRRMLDDLLDITRVTQGKFQLQIGHAHLSSMIQHCIDSLRSVFDEKGHQVIFNPPAEDKIYLNVDAVRFEQALTNILNNASKYTPPGGCITIAHSVRKGFSVITIQDNGIGVEKENLAEIFMPFWQAQRIFGSAAGGIGVGLSLTKHILEMHGGEIRADSAGRDAGTTFTIRMPLSSWEEGSKKPTRTFSPSSYSVLVVDDNKTAADALAVLLRLKGHTAKVAYSGREVFECLQEFEPSIILLDIGLADMTGYEVAQKLRAQGFKNRIVALSGFGQQEDKDKALASGFDHHFTKPMGIERFEEYLQSLQSVQPMLF